jgi:predicted DNA-binding transcriptional regulator AlpA
MPPRDKTANAALAARARESKRDLPEFVIPIAKKRRRLVSKAIVLDRIPLSYPAIWALMVADKFPRSVKIGTKIAWYEAEIDAWISGLERSRLKGDKA